jgi:hypothetical protein
VPAIAFNQVPEAIEVIKQRAAEKEVSIHWLSGSGTGKTAFCKKINSMLGIN